MTLFRDPVGTSVQLPPLTALPLQATLLNDGTPLLAVRDRGTRHFRQELEPLKITGIPATRHSGEVLVLKLEFEDGELELFSLVD